jgi:hypothetical protein
MWTKQLLDDIVLVWALRPTSPNNVVSNNVSGEFVWTLGFKNQPVQGSK